MEFAKIPERVNRLQESNALRMFGFTRENIEKQKKDEDSALTLCGALLGDCYLMQQIVMWMLIPSGNNLYNEFKKQKWFKHNIKKDINDAIKSLKNDIYVGGNGSKMSNDFMEGVAANMYEYMRVPIVKLNNDINLYLVQNGIKPEQCKPIADFIIIGILLGWTNAHYDYVLERMENMYHAFYDTWYNHASSRVAKTKWDSATDAIADKIVRSDSCLDLNESNLIKGGIMSIDKIMSDSDVAQKAVKETLKYIDEDLSDSELDRACEMFGVKNKHKNIEEPKKEESTAVVDDVFSKLSSKFKVSHLKK